MIYSILLAPLGVVPWFMGFAGLTYGIVSAIGGAIFLGMALRIYRAGDAPGSEKPARQLFLYSIFYLFALFAVLLIENRVLAFIGGGA